MWAYASSLPQKEYREWLEDGSTCTEVTIGLGPPQVDRVIKSPIPWVSDKLTHALLPLCSNQK